jgi:hypothetical protein
VPQLHTAGLPDEVGGWMAEVANWQREVGEGEMARSLCRELLEAIPDSADAQDCLDALAE